MKSTPFCTPGEELANTVSHAVGIVLGVIAGFILLSTAVAGPYAWAAGSVAVYLAGMLASYITSTCYHGCRNENRKAMWRRFDHAAIYLHIAGTYVPFTMLIFYEAPVWGWILFIGMWLAAGVGLVVSFKNLKKHSHLEAICFVLMGGNILFAFRPLMQALHTINSFSSLYWLIGGGIFYIAGAVFYSLTRRRYMHTVFHVFVLGGTVCHATSIYLLF
ncbi:MAG: hemolysin III family protein [Tannerellaceae bacterium]|nr:hemolysin III family protein [Tannerellaceae bacterium]